MKVVYPNLNIMKKEEKYSEAIQFLESILHQGNHFFEQQDYHTALQYYQKGLDSFLQSQHIPELWPAYQKIWMNKALAHQSLRQYEKMREAAWIANTLLEKIENME